MQAIFKNFICLWCIALVIGSCSKDKEPCDPNDSESPCYAGPSGNGSGPGNAGPGGETGGKCWYKITIDGQTTHPNKFGKDQITLSASMDAGDDETGFGISIRQDKGKEGPKSTLTAIMRGHLSSKSTRDDYPIGVFLTNRFNTADYQQYPVYAFADEDFDHDEAYMTFNLLENSDQRLHVKMSGVVLGSEEGNEIGLFPVEAEVIIDREYIYEVTINGGIFSGAKCDCQE